MVTIGHQSTDAGRTAAPEIPEQPGVDPRLHRFATVKDSFGDDRQWHYLDNIDLLAERGVTPRGTILAVHGNPTYSFLFRTLFRDDIDWRVIAVDQLEMGYSERTKRIRGLQDRITDLSLFTDSLGLRGPIVTVGHDWGGIISIGWALDNKHDVVGMILTNTAIYQGLGESLPKALQIASAPSIIRTMTSGTDAFLRGTINLSKPPLPSEVKAAYLAPYRGSKRRAGIEQFVADIPADAMHPSRATLERLAEGLKGMKVPSLFLWGPRDVVFSDRFLRDLIERVPHAQVHRFENASHLVWDDADVAGTIAEWLQDVYGDQKPGDTAVPSLERGPKAVSTFADQPPHVPLGSRITELAEDPATADLPAVVEMNGGPDGGRRTITWRRLEERIADLSAGMLAHGIRRGSRVSVLVEPGADLTAVLYSCLRIGAVAVVADAGLGVKGLTRAVVGSHPDFIIGIDRALIGAKVLGWPGQKISVQTLPTVDRAVLGVTTSVAELMNEGSQMRALAADTRAEDLDPDEDALILFTSGSTGPAKGAAYTHRQASAMFSAVGETLQLRPERGLVAGFAPFALLGPSLGAPSVVPDMDVTRPGELTAAALADAVDALGSPAVFTAPAALKNIIDTAGELTTEQREALARVPSFFSAGAPIPAPLLRQLRTLMPNAQSFSPYGMTECLAVAAIDLDGIEEAGSGNGVCVGRPVPRVEIAIAPVDELGRAADHAVTTAGVTGEILVRAAHVRDRYLMLWRTTREAMRIEGYHATGDIGHLDDQGRLWVEGRLAHVIPTAEGVRTPVVIEQAVESVEGVRRAGVCGVGPAGTQQIIAVVEMEEDHRPGRPAQPKPAPHELEDSIRRTVRERTGAEVTAVFTTTTLPTDIRHNSKIDRTRLAAWAEVALSGKKAKL